MAWEQNDPEITPPHIADPERGEAEQWHAGSEDEAPADDGEDSQGESRPGVNWDRLAKEAFSDSTSYINSNYRQTWEDSLRAFYNQHPGDSKYNLASFQKRSHAFIPKTRAVIRKNEAAAAAAFFSNLDTVSVQATNQADDKQRLSADVMFQILQFRLTHTIPWFQTLIGALQDAQTQGACISHIYWRFIAKSGTLEVVEDRPCIDLIPIENIRFHPASDWSDPLHTSPYLIHLIPMFIGDVKERMERPDPKGRTWYRYPEGVFSKYSGNIGDSTRGVRLGMGEDPTTSRSRVNDYDVVWVHRHIHRRRGVDHEWYTLASELRLTDPEPLKNTVFHGRRPYEMGRAILETHKTMPSSVPKLVRGLQDSLNETHNQRDDNVKFVLNKRFLVKRGANVDLPSLTRNVPGGITLVNNVEGEVAEMTWPDVTQSAYLEEDRTTGMFDELSGNFNPMQVAQQRTPRESERTMLAVAAPSNLLTEYMLKTFVETWVLPVVRQLVLLEQHYETDAAVMTLAGEKAQVRQKFGVEEVTDELLEAQLTTQINVGMGATDPAMKLQRFVYGVSNLQRISVKPPPGINLTEVYKEVFALSGYQDGTRFLSGKDPGQAALQQQLQQAMQMIQRLTQEKRNKDGANIVRLQGGREANASHERIAKIKAMSDAGKQGRDHHHERVLAMADYIAKTSTANPSTLEGEVSPPQQTMNGGA